MVCMALYTQDWLLLKKSLSLSLLCLRFAVNERAGRSPGCGCWDQHHDSAAAGSVLPDKGFRAALRPCVGRYVREPKRRQTLYR